MISMYKSFRNLKFYCVLQSGSYYSRYFLSSMTVLLPALLLILFWVSIYPLLKLNPPGQISCYGQHCVEVQVQLFRFYLSNDIIQVMFSTSWPCVSVRCNVFGGASIIHRRGDQTIFIKTFQELIVKSAVCINCTVLLYFRNINVYVNKYMQK